MLKYSIELIKCKNDFYAEKLAHLEHLMEQYSMKFANLSHKVQQFQQISGTALVHRFCSLE